MKRKIRIRIALLLSACMILSGSTAYAAQKTETGEYAFDSSKTASEQLRDMFTTIDIMDATIDGLSAEMEAGNVSSEQITQMYIDRIRAYDRKLKLNSIICINPDALNDARALDRERAEGHIRGPLHGIPVVVKDNIDAAGMATSGGSLALAHMFPDSDAFVVKKLKDAGAVILAKANLSEFASSAVDSHSLIGGDVHNAYDTSRVPAGSSGGTGVAVTSNFAAAGLGTDTGGSIRNPSSYSNLYGIRPTKGLTSVHGVIPLMVPRDTVGPMARTAEDMALMLQTIAGTDENDDYTAEAQADELAGGGYTDSLSADGLKGKRIGYLTSSFDYKYTDEPEEEGEDTDPQAGGSDEGGATDGDTDPEAGGSDEDTEEPLPEEIIKVPDAKIEAMIKRTRADLRKAGAEFVDLSDLLTDKKIAEMYNCNSDDVAEYDFNRYLFEKGDAAPYRTLKELYNSGRVGVYHTNLPVYGEEELEKMADSFEEMTNPYDTEINGFMRAATWKDALECRAEVMKIMEENDIDAVMYLASLDVPPRENCLEDFKFNNGGWAYGFIFGPALGLPEVVLPMGFSDTDDNVGTELPLGMRFFGKYGDEKTLMEIAYAYEQQAGADIRRMPENSPALEDKNLEAYLEALMDQVYSIDYGKYNVKPEGKVKLMETAYAKAAAADTTDPYAAYRAAEKLAKSYDSVMKALKASGIKQKKAATSFKLSLSKKKLKAKYRKAQTVKVKVSGLTKGSSKPVFSVRKVTNGQKSKVKINKRTGKVTIKKKTKKCKIVIQATSVANQTHSALTKSITITVK